MPVEIVVDAMGSDKAPESEIRGAILASRTLDVQVTLAGPEHLLQPALAAANNHKLARPVQIVHASEWITMHDKAAQAVRSKLDSSMRVGLKRVHAGKAQGFFTAGNTGAAMVTAKMVLRALQGVDRPALATAFPTISGSPTLVLDVGANVDCDPENLLQFAIMGSIYARNVLKIAKPRVGLLSIGEEDSKGDSLTRATLPLLRNLAGIHFIGNVEGRDLYTGSADVVVCDGFVGNVALKASEGVAKLVMVSLRDALTSNFVSKLGAMLSRPAFNQFRKRIDYSEYGGAPLLGVRGSCVIGHGSSNEVAIMNGIRVAAEFASAHVTADIEAALSRSTVPSA